MSYCLNPTCQAPGNPDTARFCQGCGTTLLLKNRYRPQTLIGQGGFGRTFLAADEDKPSHPPCVIKQFFPQDQGIKHGEKAAELFRQEAQRLEELGKHPQIAGLLAHFDQDRRQYMVQEFINGQTLDRELVAQGPFSEVQIWHLLNQLLPVLQFLHERQVIHRDIKPENIIKRADLQTAEADELAQNKGDLVLVDFGAAKLATGTALQRTGTVIGSAGYTAPEQLMGKAVFASDLYSLGVTCIHLLTQVPPFDLFDISESAWIWRDRLPYPVSQSLGHVLDKLLKSGTKQRYASAAEVLQEPKFKQMRLGQDARWLSLPAGGPQPLSSTQNRQPSLSQSSSIPGGQVSWSCIHTIAAHQDQVRSVAFSPDGQRLASGSYDFTIGVRHFHTGELLHALKGHLDLVLSISFSPEGRMLASSSYDSTIQLWDVETGSPLKTLTGHRGHVWSVNFSPDGQLLASSSSDRTIKLWQPQTGKLMGSLGGHVGVVQAAVFSPDGRWLASSGYDRKIRFWDPQNRKLLRLFSGHSGAVRALTFSPDGQILVSGSYDRTIKLWDVATTKPIRTLTGHRGEIWSVAFSPDGQILASSSYDKTIKLWEPKTGTLLSTLSWHNDAVWSVAFSPDGQILASGSGDNTIKIWRKPI